MDYATLKQRIRSLVDDPDARFATDTFLVDKVAQCYDDLYDKLRTADVEFDEQVIELIGVKAGVDNLGELQKPGKPLEFLIYPEVFEWKLTGLDKTEYSEAGLTARLLDTQPTDLLTAWEWRAGVIYFSPVVVDVDIRIRGDFMPTQLLAEADVISVGKNVGAALAYWTCSLIGTVRGNAAWEKSYRALGDLALEDILMTLTKEDQKQVRRIGRSFRHGPVSGPLPGRFT